VVFGRGTDLIISGGENIDPAEVELALEKHPAVHSAAVIGRKQARWGQRPVAYLVPSGPERPSIEALRSYLSTMLPPFKRPDSVHWLSELPRGPLGKLRRSVLRDQVQALEGIKEG
jgi:acyl-CoA synthetase (AMP-forming)/AMP-acid ligase II